ncbi:invasion associated locus B family protein [Vibrio sp. TH_r3]|uniref:invasion associated locus B family protein n=1 Tax=Vibrio sp. TH_r3 TaxID=3082084 RepID=UPI00295328D4|nr:invasion associated locus B family protein [Vibrio sp. TH_r3]MDV7105577.1 invasion associated locus B family protein [Vibrio sp. TH_r3]
MKKYGIGFLLSIPMFTVAAKDYGAWSLLCDTKQDHCSIAQVVATDPDAKNVLMGLSIDFSESSQRPTMSIRVSSQVATEKGMGFKVDNNTSITLPFIGCDEKVCVSKVWMDDRLIHEMKTGDQAVVAYLLPAQKQIVLPLSMRGFSQAIDALESTQLSK